MKKILIIEDEPEIAALERDYLIVSGYDVTLRNDGVSGLREALSQEYSLVVLDIMLPGLDGFSVLLKLREKTDVPVIILSAKSEDIDKIRGLGLGADDYMLKPFSPSELVARVRAHITRYEKLTGGRLADMKPTVEIRGLHIDKNDRRVTVRGRETQLTPKEYDILLFLAESPNRVFSKEEIFERIWGLDALGDIGTVVVHVRRLREKIENDPQNPQYIETVWGAGYRMRG